MKEWSEKGKELNELIRPLTFPLAVRLIRSEEEIPEKARRPSVDLKIKLSLCQGMTISRRYGWTVAMTAQDNGCAVAKVAYGWEEKEDEAKMGDFFFNAGYAANPEVGVRIAKGISRFKQGEFAGVIFSPLAWTKVIPDLILIYGNPAQIMRLIHGATYHEGDKIYSQFSGRAASCTEGIIETMLTGEPRVLIPGNGDRVWAMAQDDEVAFTIPAAKLGQIVEGLRASHERGIRYPVPIYQRFQPEVRLSDSLSDIF